MMCYKDRWFCPFWEDCAKAKECDRPLTDEVRAAAMAAQMDIQQVADKPQCHKPVNSDKP